MTTPAEDIAAGTDAPSSLEFKNCGGPWTPTTSSDFQFSYFRRVRGASVSNPKSHSNWRFPSSWDLLEVRSTIDTDGYSRWTSDCGGGDFEGFRYAGPMMAPLTEADLPPFPGWMQDVANTKALLKLKNLRGSNLSSDIVQWRQTSNMFANTAESIAKSVRNWRGANTSLWSRVLREGERGFRGIPESWLELQYGWNPLMGDIQGACQALSESYDSYSHRVNVSGEVTDNGSHRSDPYYCVNGAQYGSYRWQLSWKHECRTSLWYTLDSPLLASFSSLGLTNPLSLVWELLKYSFVVDWFLPVGNWLSTFDADFGWRFLGGSTSKFTRATGRADMSPSDFVLSDVDASSRPGQFSAVHFSRLALNDTPGVGVPHFKNPLSGLHVANALSLLVQAFR